MNTQILINRINEMIDPLRFLKSTDSRIQGFKVPKV